MYSKIAMKGVKPKVCRLIIADFYRKNLARGKSYTVRHFKRMGYKKPQIYTVMKRVDEGEPLVRRKSQGGPQKLSTAQE